ncbi:MAG: N-6 DNA methylase [Microcystis aeruginosa L211-101]|nr:N-6 DNA methylase [Microcystis aeruginosa L211-11]NCR29567.1 N-6 DNA methylase [Microcystis aeruginosa L211-101]
MKEQGLLFSEDSLLPEKLPQIQELRPSNNLSAVFEECHNYIYANEGMLKDKIFHEMVKLIIIKLHDEKSAKQSVNFGVTASEYKAIVANKSDEFMSRLSQLFTSIKNHYRGFFTDDTFKLKPLTLAYIVGRLQYINLTKTSGDIKGEAFQTFVNRHQRGDRGEFFTPHPIVRLAVEMIDPKPNEKIIDPACGSGGFLIQAINHVRQNNPEFDIASFVQESITGIEFNPDVALSGMIRLVFEGGTGSEIICTNALIEDEKLNNSFDVILTNPPFGNKGKVEDQKILQSYLLARKWHKSASNGWEVSPTVLAGQSPDILFIEKSIKLLRAGGRMAIILPDGLLQNISNGPIRHWLRSQTKILGVVSIPPEAFVPYGTGIKTSLLVVQKLPANHDSCFMAQIKKIGYDVKGQTIYKRNESGVIARTKSGLPIVDDDIDDISQSFRSFINGEFAQNSDCIYTVKNTLLNSRLDAEHYLPNDQKLLEHLKSIGAKPLGEIADILRAAADFRLARDSEIRYIAISDVDYRTMQVVSQQIIKAHEAPSRATYRLYKGDIITAISGASTGSPRQATALITEDEDGAICSNGFSVLRNIQGVEPLFLLVYMRTDFFLRQIKRYMTGHAIPTILVDDLSKVLVPIPPKSEQQRIVKSMAEIQAIRKEALKASENVVNEMSLLLGQFE